MKILGLSIIASIHSSSEIMIFLESVVFFYFKECRIPDAIKKNEMGIFSGVNAFLCLLFLIKKNSCGKEDGGGQKQFLPWVVCIH